jgi:peptidylprolyl isomerase/FKBP-type peptidyl-prolyl cis-trans isomerase FklB
MIKPASLAFAMLAAMAGCTTVPKPPQTPAGPDFLARNAKAKNVVKTASGLEYFVVKSGPEDAPRPGPGDRVTFDYEGQLTTGETFDSSYARGQPLSGGVGDFVPGFTEALMLMRPGDEWIVWIPPQLGYGDRELPSIPANSVLRFRMELRSVTPAPPSGASITIGS